MKLVEIVDKLGLAIKAGADHLETEVTGGYASDMLSDVIGNAEIGNVWITMQIHENMVAIAGMKDLVAVLICAGRTPEQTVIDRANEQEVALVTSPLPSFEIAGRLYGAGIRGV